MANRTQKPVEIPTTKEATVESRYSDLYTKFIDYLRNNKLFKKWLSDSCRIQRKKHSRGETNNNFLYPHHAHKLLTCKPEESVGLLLAIKPYRYDTLRLLFPTLWDREGQVTTKMNRYAAYRTLVQGVIKQMDEDNVLRHMHAQANWSFGMRRKPSEPHILQGMAWAAMESRAALYCGDVDQLGNNIWDLELIDGQSFKFESAIGDTHVPLGLKSVAYLPVDLDKDGPRILLAFYSPQQNMFGPSISDGKPFLCNPLFLKEHTKQWISELKRLHFFRFAIESVRSYDTDLKEAFDLGTGGIAGAVTSSSPWYQEEFKTLVAKLKESTNLSTDIDERVGRMLEFIEPWERAIASSAHIRLWETLRKLRDNERAKNKRILTGEEMNGIRAVIGRLVRESDVIGKSLDERRDVELFEQSGFQALSADIGGNDSQAVKDVVDITSALFSNAVDAVKEFVESFKTQSIDLSSFLQNSLGQIDFENSPAGITVSNWVPYTGSLLKRYWAVRQGLILTRREGSEGGWGGYGLFLARTLAEVNGYMLEISLDIPKLGQPFTRWVGTIKFGG